MKTKIIRICLLPLIIFGWLLNLFAQPLPPPAGKSDFPSAGDSLLFRINHIPVPVSFNDTTKKNDSLTIDKSIYKALNSINDDNLKNLSWMKGHQTFILVSFLYNYLYSPTLGKRVYKLPGPYTPGVNDFPDADFYYSETVKNTASNRFLKLDTTGYYELGQRMLTTIQYSIINSPMLPIVLFPLDYKNPSNVINKKIQRNGGPGPSRVKLDITADAYGKLYFVKGSVSNPDTVKYDTCLRTLTHRFDSTEVSQGVLLRTETKKYDFYVPGFPEPFVSFSYSKVRSNLSIELWPFYPDWIWHDTFDMTLITYNSRSAGIHNSTFNIQNLNVYPNPSDGIFNINLISANLKPGSVIEVYDIPGNIVYCSKISGQNNLINLSGKAKGLYLVKIYNDKEIIIKKVIIK